MTTLYEVAIDEAVWERTSFTALVPGRVPPHEHEDWIREHIVHLLSVAHTRGGLTVEVVGSVESYDDVIEITPF